MARKGKEKQMETADTERVTKWPEYLSRQGYPIWAVEIDTIDKMSTEDLAAAGFNSPGWLLGLVGGYPPVMFPDVWMERNKPRVGDWLAEGETGALMVLPPGEFATFTPRRPFEAGAILVDGFGRRFTVESTGPLGAMLRDHIECTTHPVTWEALATLTKLPVGP